MSRFKRSTYSSERPDAEELSDHTSGVDTDDPEQKDHTELELEKLVFGNAEGFRKGLKSHTKSAAPSISVEGGDAQNLLFNESVADNLQDVDDTDVCGLSVTFLIDVSN